MFKGYISYVYSYIHEIFYIITKFRTTNKNIQISHLIHCNTYLYLLLHIYFVVLLFQKTIVQQKPNYMQPTIIFVAIDKYVKCSIFGKILFLCKKYIYSIIKIVFVNLNFLGWFNIQPYLFEVKKLLGLIFILKVNCDLPSRVNFKCESLHIQRPVE